MTILHIPFTYFPSPAGGTEVYVAALCRELTRLGIGNAVAAPGSANETYRHEGVPVHRFAIQPKPDFEMLNAGKGDPTAAGELTSVIDKLRPSLVHFHAFTPAISNLSLELVRKRGLPAVFTYHTPTATCPRGTLMRWGTTPCDGQLTPMRCAACRLESLGIPKPAAIFAAGLSPALQFLAPLLPAQARWQLPARATPTIAAKHRRVRNWLSGMQAVIALNEWSRLMLGEIGVPPEKLHKVRHGLPYEQSSVTTENHYSHTKPIRLAFLGRLDPLKGVDLVLDALALTPDLPVQLDLFTLIENQRSEYVQRIQGRLNSDARVRQCPPLPPGEVVERLRDYAALVVPSIWMETGPLVVLEALAAGIPVIGSKIGGISEWVEDGRNGLLVPSSTAKAWAEAVCRAVTEPGLLEQLRAGIAAPRLMSDVAADMVHIYQKTVPA